MPDVQHALTPGNPLMQPVQYAGQEYFTSQFFHQQYLTNSQAGGKYRQHSNFLQTLRSIEAYATYTAHGDIIELVWHRIKTEGNENLISFQPLFQAAGWNPLTLLNATAQAAMSHHLDDAISKQLSVTINTTIARQARRSTELLPIDVAERTMEGSLRIAAMLGAPLHIAQQEAVKLVTKETGLDFHSLLLAAPAQDNIPQTAMMLEPTKLAKEFGWGDNKGAAMNKHIEALGWQVRKIGGGWEPTTTGKQYCIDHAWTSDHSTNEGYNLKWNVAAVRQALRLEATP